jgi:hypothetical protein
VNVLYSCSLFDPSLFGVCGDSGAITLQQTVTWNVTVKQKAIVVPVCRGCESVTSIVDVDLECDDS